MEFQINTNNVILIQQDQVESGEYNVTECNFIFSSKYEGLTKKAVFTGEDGTAYLQTIVDNKCSIPSEILEVSQVVQIGVYAYAVENEELILRYSPEPTDFFIHEGSYKEAQNSTPPTPSEIEQLQAQITTNANNIEELQECCGKYDSDIAEIKAEQITQNTSIHNNADNIETINEQISDINETITNLETNKANVTDLNALTERVSTNERDIDTIDGHISDINQNIDDLEQDLTNYSLITETGSQIELNINSSDFKLKAILKDKNGNTIYTSNIIDLPLETMVVGASYDNVTKEVVLTLQNGTTLRFSVADLVSGLVSTDQLTQILSNYYNKTEVNNLLANHYTKSETDTLLNEKANQTSLDTTNQNVTNLTGRVSTNEEDIADIKEEQTTQNTNIEELQNQVETLQEDLESANAEIEELNTDITNMAKAMYKVDGQGSDIILPNTSENKFVEFGLEGRTEQEQLSGKNLADDNYSNYTTTGGTYAYKKLIEDFTKTYLVVSIVDKKPTTPLSAGIYFGFTANGIDFTEGGNWIIANSEISNTNKYTNTYKYLSFSPKTQSVLDEIFDKYEIQIELNDSTTPTSYEPYCGGIPSPNPDYTQQIKNVTGNANVKIQNLVNVLNWNEFSNYSNWQPAVANNYKSFKIEGLKPQTKYTICRVNDSGYGLGLYAGFNNDNNNTNMFIHNSDANRNKQFISFTSTAQGVLYVVFYMTNISTFQQYLDVIQDCWVIEGENFKQKEEQNYPFTFAEGQRGMEGTQLLDDGIHQKRKQRVLNGTEFWNVTSRSNGYQFVTVNPLGKRGDNSKVEILSNYFKGIKFNDRDTQSESIYSYEGDNDIRILTNVATNVDDFKQWLSTHNVIVEFILAEEEIIPYNETQQAQYNDIEANATSYDDITIISSESDELGFDMNVVAVADANKVIDNQNNEIDTIKSRLDLLEG